MAKVYATRAQVVKISDLFREHLKPVEGSDLFAYDGDWSDTKIAEAAATVANPINPSHVANLRAELFGNLQARREASPVDGRVTALEKFVEAQAAEIKALRSRVDVAESLHSKLCKRLSTSHGIDVTHLAGFAPQHDGNGHKVGGLL